jgi:hypothetical protein
MRVSINPTLNLETMAWLPCLSYEYCGPILSFKGDNTANAAEASQNAFDQSLMTIFRQQYGTQTQLLNYLTGKLQPQINAGGQGYTPAQLTAMRTSATDTIANQFNAAQSGVNAAAARTGGSALPSGVSTMIESSLAPQEALAQSQAQNAITTENATLQQQNYWNAVNALTGQEAVANPLGYSAGATSGTNAVSNASQAVTAAQGPSALQVVGGIVGGGLAAAAGPGGALSKLVA